MAPHSSTLAWKIPWTEKPRGLQSMGSWRVRHDWATSLSLFTFMHWRRKLHSSVLAWRIPGTGEPGGLLSMGLHRVGHDWSDSSSSSSMSKVRGRAKTITAFRLCVQCFLSLWLLALIFRRRKGGECSYGLGATAPCSETLWSCREDWIQNLLSAHGSQSNVEMGRAECVSTSLPHWLCGFGSFSCFSEPRVVVKIRWDDMCPVRQGRHQAPSGQRAGAAAPWGTAGDEEINETGSGLWEFFSVHPVKRHMMLICLIICDIKVHYFVVFPRFSIAVIFGEIHWDFASILLVLKHFMY